MPELHEDYGAERFAAVMEEGFRQAIQTTKD